MLIVKLAKSKEYRSVSAISIKLGELNKPVSRGTVVKILKEDYQWPLYYHLPNGEWRFWDKVKLVKIK